MLTSYVSLHIITPVAVYGLNCKNDSNVHREGENDLVLKKRVLCGCSLHLLVLGECRFCSSSSSSSCPIMAVAHRLSASLPGLLLERACTACVHRQEENKIHTRASSLSPRYCATSHLGCSLEPLYFAVFTFITGLCRPVVYNLL